MTLESQYYPVKQRGVKAINDYSTAMKKRQDWMPGEIVNVGFMKNLTVLRKNTDGTFALQSSKGVKYTFTPHQGISRDD